MQKIILNLLLIALLSEIHCKQQQAIFTCGKCQKLLSCSTNNCWKNKNNGELTEGCFDGAICPSQPQKLFISKCQKDYLNAICKSGFCILQQNIQICQGINLAQCQQTKMDLNCSQSIVEGAETLFNIQSQCPYDQVKFQIKKCTSTILGQQCSCCKKIASTNLNMQVSGGICVKQTHSFKNFHVLLNNKNEGINKKTNKSLSDATISSTKVNNYEFCSITITLLSFLIIMIQLL